MTPFSVIINILPHQNEKTMSHECIKFKCKRKCRKKSLKTRQTAQQVINKTVIVKKKLLLHRNSVFNNSESILKSSESILHLNKLKTEK